MEKRTGTVNPPIIMNTFVNEAFEDEGDDNIVENNNSGWGNVNLDAVLKHAGDIDKTKMSALLNIPGTPRTRDRKISQICAKVGIQTRRKQNLIEIRESILAISRLNAINQAQLQTLLSDRNFCLIFFRLFDDNEDGILEQSVWFGKLKYWYQANIGEKTKESQNRLDFIDLIEAITYLVCEDHGVTPEGFHKAGIRQSHGVMQVIILISTFSNFYIFKFLLQTPIMY
jgi:hypothetical protein